MANYKSSVMSAPPLNRYRLTVNSHRGHVAAMLFLQVERKSSRRSNLEQIPRENVHIRTFFRILSIFLCFIKWSATSDRQLMHHLRRYDVCTRVASYLQWGESIAFHCPTLTRETSFDYSYIVLQSHPQPLDCSLTRWDDCRFSVRQTRVIYVQKCAAIFFRPFVFH